MALLAGPPASGKSTIAKKLRAKFPEALYISSDALIERYARWCGLTYNDVFHKAIKRATARIKKLVKKANEQKLNVIWDQCNLTRKTRLEKASLFPGYERILIYAPKYHPGFLRDRNLTRDRSPLAEHIIFSMNNQYEYPGEDELVNDWDGSYRFDDLT